MYRSIVAQVGVHTGVSAGDDDADRKRLKERLKSAIDAEKRRNQGVVVGSKDGQAWLEYLFGICEPDRSIGKLGSRYFCPRLQFIDERENHLVKTIASRAVYDNVKLGG